MEMHIKGISAYGLNNEI